nr:MAG TPA: hypothetical protein [Caudoviricetes sp.]
MPLVNLYIPLGKKYTVFALLHKLSNLLQP